MGTWSFGAFDNDDASDWVYDLEGNSDYSLVESAINTAIQAGDEYLEAPEACCALAAIESLALAIGNKSEKIRYPEVLLAWASSVQLKPTINLIQKAEKVIELVLSDSSELRELWQDSKSFDDWFNSVSDVKARLQL